MMSRLGSCCMAGDWFGMPESLSFHYAGMADLIMTTFRGFVHLVTYAVY